MLLRCENVLVGKTGFTEVHHGVLISYNELEGAGDMKERVGKGKQQDNIVQHASYTI